MDNSYLHSISGQIVASPSFIRELKLNVGFRSALSSVISGFICLSVLLSSSFCLGKGDGDLTFELVDAKSGEPVATRIHLKNARNRTVRARGWGKSAHADHAYIDGNANIELRKGTYHFALDAGPEYRTLVGNFEIDRDASDLKKIELKRFANLAEEGWYSADLAAQRPAEEYGFLCRAEKLAYFAQIGWEWDKKLGWKPVGKLGKGKQPAPGSSAVWQTTRGTFWLHDPTGELSAEHLPAPKQKTSTDLLIEARKQGWLVVASPTSWELPIWIGNDLVDALLVIDGMAELEADGAKKLTGYQSKEPRFADPRGQGLWREAIHHQLLEAGVHLPAVAASGSGLNDNPLGTSRAYFHSDRPASLASNEADAGSEGNGSEGNEAVAAFSRSEAWEQILAGATVVSNGPLLRPWVEGSPPGAELDFSMPPGGVREVFVALNMATRDKVDYLELIQNGKVAKSIRLMDWAAAGGKLPPLEFTAPGWFMVRAVTEEGDRYQFASSGPYFVGKQGQRTTAASVRFFLDWLDEYANRLKLKETSREYPSYQHAKAFWEAKRDNASDP